MKKLIPVLLEAPAANQIHISKANIAAGIMIMYKNKDYPAVFRIIEDNKGKFMSINLHGKNGHSRTRDTLQEVLNSTKDMGNQYLIQLNGLNQPLIITDQEVLEEYVLAQDCDFNKGVIYFHPETNKFLGTIDNRIGLESGIKNGFKVYQVVN